MLYDLGRHDEASPELEMASGAPEALYLSALIESRIGETEGAKELLVRAVELNPRHADAHYQLGLIYSRTGDSGRAADHWKQAVSIDAGHAQALYNLARLLRTSDPEQARRYQERFEDGQKERRITDRAETLGNFALASADARDWPQAIAQLREAIQVCVDCRAKALLHKNLGLIFARSGDLVNAESFLTDAATMLPDDQDLARSLDLISSYRGRASTGPVARGK